VLAHRRGHCLHQNTTWFGLHQSTALQNCLRVNTAPDSGSVGRRVDVDDLVDAQVVAELLGLSRRESVSVYQGRYGDMPRPVVDLGRGRPRLWLRREIEAWACRTGRLPRR
jgi:hypothetical protein